MSEHLAADTDPKLVALGKEARRLAMDLPGIIRRLSIRSGEDAVEIEWHGTGSDSTTATAPTASPAPPTGPAMDGIAEEDGPGTVVLTSPMVGTFYRAPRPDADPFVAVGDAVEKGQTVCVIEAMKLFNPIESECAGVVAEIFVENGQPVEFGQPLAAFTVETSQSQSG